MRRAKRLQQVLDMELAKEREAAQVLGASRDRVLEDEQQLERLSAYRDEYAVRVGKIDRTRLIEYRAFLGKLNEAIHGQQRKLDEARRLLARRLAEWQGQRGKVKSMENVVNRAKAELDLQTQRKEQREGDEQGQRLGREQGEGPLSKAG